MSNRKKDCPYRELGRTLEDWRVARFRSVLAMFREARFSFSYYTYADYERGALLPSVADIVELAKYFNVDERQAVLRWAEVQMPSFRLKSLFSQTSQGLAARLPREESREPEDKQKGPSFENTWVFGNQEQTAIRKFAWFFELCQRLAMAHPKGLSAVDLGFKKQAELDHLVRDHLQPWIAQGRMVFQQKRLFLTNPHIHLPKTGPWQEIREINLERVIGRLSKTINNHAIQTHRAHREIVTRTLSGEQIEFWAKRLHEIEAEFKAIPYIDEGTQKVYSYVSIFGERTMSFTDQEA